QRILADVPLNDDEARFTVAFVTYALRSIGYDDSTGALRAIEEAIAVVHSPRQHELLLAFRVIGLVETRQPAEAAQLIAELGEWPAADIRARGRICLTIARLQTGDLTESVAVGTAGWEQLAQTLGWPLPLSVSVGWRATVLSDLPDLPRASAEMAAAY